RVSVIVDVGGRAILITKGAFHQVLEICTRTADGAELDEAGRRRLEARYEDWSGQGIRVLAVASRAVDAGGPTTRDAERDMAFAGFLTFLDQPKPDAAA